MPARVVPVTYDHKEHAIFDNGRPYPHLDDILDADVAIQLERDRAKHDDDRPVTVADLLDAYLSDDVRTFDALTDLADEPTYHSYSRTRHAVATHRHLAFCLARLSPEERAEFDRRTT